MFSSIMLYLDFSAARARAAEEREVVERATATAVAADVVVIETLVERARSGESGDECVGRFAETSAPGLVGCLRHRNRALRGLRITGL